LTLYLSPFPVDITTNVFSNSMDDAALDNIVTPGVVSGSTLGDIAYNPWSTSTHAREEEAESMSVRSTSKVGARRSYCGKWLSDARFSLEKQIILANYGVDCILWGPATVNVTLSSRCVPVKSLYPAISDRLV
jgi:hypothetical protein